ncbi:hypothetical protein MNBD_CHLOROFLEXI01-3546 [hydrothermal vent metagenome]|uniref:Uncharacterized protein n=1 Tax=hydrothermal vent metagenome TaxID=652676 RepID=A0A3B0UGI9_9ZZZZ
MSDILAKVKADEEKNGRFWQQFKLLWSGLFVLATAVATIVGWQNEGQSSNQQLLALTLRRNPKNN